MNNTKRCKKTVNLSGAYPLLMLLTSPFSFFSGAGFSSGIGTVSLGVTDSLCVKMVVSSLILRQICGIFCYGMNSADTYDINKLNGYFSGNEIFFDDGSVEHIISETEGDIALNNIGNLILLELALNGEAGDQNYTHKLSVYKKSNYIWIKRFIKENPQWSLSQIKLRAKELTQIYYREVLKK